MLCENWELGSRSFHFHFIIQWFLWMVHICCTRSWSLYKSALACFWSSSLFILFFIHTSDTCEQIIIVPIPELSTHLSDLTKMSSQNVLSLTIAEIVPALSIHLDWYHFPDSIYAWNYITYLFIWALGCNKIKVIKMRNILIAYNIHRLFTIQIGLNHQNKEKISLLRFLIWLWYGMATAIKQSK